MKWFVAEEKKKPQTLDALKVKPLFGELFLRLCTKCFVFFVFVFVFLYFSHVSLQWIPQIAQNHIIEPNYFEPKTIWFFSVFRLTLVTDQPYACFFTEITRVNVWCTMSSHAELNLIGTNVSKLKANEGNTEHRTVILCSKIYIQRQMSWRMLSKHLGSATGKAMYTQNLL